MGKRKKAKRAASKAPVVEVPATKIMRLGDINRCAEILTIRRIDSHLVHLYAKAMRRYGTLDSWDQPLIVEDAPTNRLVVGYHTLEAALLVFGPEHSVSVRLRRFNDLVELVNFGGRTNLHHGQRYTTYNIKKWIAFLARHGQTPQQIAEAVELNCVTVEMYLAANVSVIAGNGPNDQPVNLPVKRCIGSNVETMTLEQWQVSDAKDIGASDYVIAHQLIRHLENGFVDWQDPKVSDTMRQLYYLLDEQLQVQVLDQEAVG